MARTTGKRFITNETGEKKAIILDIEEYRKLLEDLEDLRLIAERKAEPSIPFDLVKKGLKDSGLL
jgi:PHD/YefM family antitoxin component YafN of YafNO toxin-antitoxin module